jgi:Flp pilus assembly protein protease CpaA
MSTSTIVMVAILAVLVVLYIGRRRGRMGGGDRD